MVQYIKYKTRVPPLSISYINDLHTVAENFTSITYADDTTLFNPLGLEYTMLQIG